MHLATNNCGNECCYWQVLTKGEMLCNGSEFLLNMPNVLMLLSEAYTHSLSHSFVMSLMCNLATDGLMYVTNFLPCRKQPGYEAST